MDNKLARFFQDFFGIDVNKIDNLDQKDFPTFEEVLGILELADAQDDSFRGWPGAHLTNNSTSSIQHIHDLLVFLNAKIIYEKLKTPGGSHVRLLRALEEIGWLDTTAFVSFNYDILIDNALLDFCEKSSEGISFHYAIPLKLLEPKPSTPPGLLMIPPGSEWGAQSRPIPLFKLHGSLNWLYCPTCRSMLITPHEKGIIRFELTVSFRQA